MTQLALALLGPMQVVRQGQLVVTFPYEKVRALLAYLVIESHQSHHRDQLAALLWADQSEANARGNLRKALSVLRQLLGDETAEPLFFTTRHTIQFNSLVEHTLDVTALTALLNRYQHHSVPAHQLSPKCVADLEQAVSLYHGSFLDQIQLPDNEAFEAWVLFNRDRYHVAMMDACTKLIAYYEHQRHSERVQKYVQRQLQLEPWNEAAHRSLMRIWAQSGRRTAALQQYARCCQILEREFAAEPEPATVAIWEAIRSNSFSTSDQRMFHLVQNI